MSESSLDNAQLSRLAKLARIIGLPLWVGAAIIVTYVVVFLVLQLLARSGVGVIENSALGNAVLAAVIYVISLVIALGVPWLFTQRSPTLRMLGLWRWPSWTDIGLSFAAFVLYFLLSAILIQLAKMIVPGFDVGQTQETGFEILTGRFDILLAFITLVIVAPLAEEMLFRGYLYGKLRQVSSMWIAIPITSALFALIHGQWNVAIDVFALSVLLCALREVTDSIWSGIFLHMLKNGVAFYLLFINPTLLSIMGG